MLFCNWSSITSLKKYGLSENEASIYQFLLGKYEATVYEIAKKLSIPRATTYKVLESLRKQNLVSTFKKNNIAHFALESAKQLLNNLDEKKTAIEAVLSDMQRIIEKAKLQEPSTKLYIGKEGAKIVWEDVLETLKKKKLKEVYAITHPKVYDFLPRYFAAWIKRREALGVTAKLIYAHTKKDKSYKSDKLLEKKFLPPGYSFLADITIYGDKVALLSLEGNEIHSVTIESPTLTSALLQFFLYTWHTLPTD